MRLPGRWQRMKVMDWTMGTEVRGQRSETEEGSRCFLLDAMQTGSVRRDVGGVDTHRVGSAAEEILVQSGSR